MALRYNIPPPPDFSAFNVTTEVFGLCNITKPALIVTVNVRYWVPSHGQLHLTQLIKLYKLEELPKKKEVDKVCLKPLCVLGTTVAGRRPTWSLSTSSFSLASS